ncbi:S8 family peptidase [Streptomyces sp. NPDC050529]|uniref:S8 family peptidase n=1 Tax=unclassified Streptomyces TaxID=2593676 RepID=UPI002DD7F07B|nr:S8 family serine peptidase [Streptomyces sp. NBC_01022]WRZ80285.1 S8 family serine peptidase [Streptomyces sp. NBC_01022]
MRSISRSRFLPAATALTMALTGWAGVSAAAAADPTTAAPASGPAGPSYDITLVTGDVVHYTDLPGANDVVTVDLADPNAGGVQVRTQGDHTYAVPTQAMPLLAADRLDPRLFDVTELVAMGYDDARTGSVPLIATAPENARSARPPAAPEGATTVHTLKSIDATAMRAAKDDARAFWKDVAPGKAPRTLGGGIGKLWLDGKVKASLADETSQIKATDAWQKGYDGKGVKVAVLDTGADLDHPDLVGQVDVSKSFVPGEDVDDGHGHGTHTASTIAGTGAASGGKEKGAAPGARLLIGKVLSNKGSSGSNSDVIAGMEWAKDQGADIVSMSLGTPDGSDGEDPMSEAVNTLSANGGPLFVIAAGNAYDPGTIGAPGAAASALTVAAVDRNDERAEFSSQGPLTGTHQLKPDVSAPGVDVSAAASQSVPGWTGGLYRTMSGTSMATPLVAGTAAILKERHPGWSGERIKNALMSTSHRTEETPFETGTGRVDTVAAMDSTIEATGSVAAATYNWPNADAKAATRTITYRNDGDADVTLDLATGTEGDAYTLSASSVKVPANGTAEVTLTLDPSKAAAGTTFSGQVAATDAASGAVVAHTGFGLFKEAEMYDFTIKVKDRDGKPASDSVAFYDAAAALPSYINVDGEKTLRLPPGRYSVSSYMDVPGESSDSLGEALLISNEVTLDAGHKQGTAVLDATRARKVSAVPERKSETSQTVFGLSRQYADASQHGWSTSLLLPAKYDSVYLTPTEQVADGSLKAFMSWRMRQQALTATTGTRREVTLVPQGGTAYHDGTDTLKTVYAGQGAAADYDGVDARGKAVVIDRSDAVTAAQRAQAASAAGAAMLIVAHDTRGRLYQTYSGGGDVTIASVPQADGARLVAEAKSGRGTLRVTQRQFPDYTYDLVEKFDGRIPDRSLAYKPDNGDLTRLNTSYYGAKGTLGLGGRYFVPTWSPALGGDSYEQYGRTRTEYVTPDTSDVGAWWEQHQGLGDAANYWESGYTQAPAARSAEAAWFKPVQAPRPADGYSVYATGTNTLIWNIPMLSGGDAGHAGFGGTARTSLHRGDTQLAQVNSRAGRAYNLTTGSYQLVAAGQRGTTAWSTSTTTSTTWGFDFKAAPAGTLARQDVPMLNLGYDVDTDLQGAARAGKHLRLGLHAYSFPGDVTADSATLQVSYDDGATWRDAKLKRAGDGRWTAQLDTPRNARAMSLRAGATARGGLSVQQDVIRAVTLR